jgi:predicted DNA-binding ribbon-helix-helix protein
MMSPVSFDIRKVRNVLLHGKRTSIGLEPPFWDSLVDVAKRENLSVNRLIERIEATRLSKPVADELPPLPLTPAIRVFLVSYYRAMAERRLDASPLDVLLSRCAERMWSASQPAE